MAQWWDEWQLRILVLASLTAQYFLILFAGVRKFHIPPWLRVSFRLAHIGSDLLAIFVLATLFNHQKSAAATRVAACDLELLWAPVVLMHLGGQAVITTYKIEDNEQWSRHILTSLSKGMHPIFFASFKFDHPPCQVTVGLYVFYKSWSSDEKRLLAATILLFILVTIRCIQKALDLKSSSFNALRKASSSEVSVVRGINDRDEGQLGNFIKRAGEVMENVDILRKQRSTDEPHPSLPYQQFLDIPSPFHDRVEVLRNFWSLRKTSAYLAIEGALSAMTSFLYTKDDSTPYPGLKNAPTALIFRRCTQLLVYATLITAICLVHTSSRKEAYSGEDTRVTLVLLYGTLLLELVYLCVQSAFQDKFSGIILQHNLLGSLAHNRCRPRLKRMAGWLQCEEFVEEYFGHMEPSYLFKEITELVIEHVESGWKEYIRDNETYRRFNDSRGEWILASKRCLRLMGRSLKRPFDESIIVWHLATNLCFHHDATSPDDHESARRCKVMSNYMIHLLCHNPEMVMPDSRKGLFARANDELEHILNSEKAPRNEREFTRQVIEMCDSGRAPDYFIVDADFTSPFMVDAWVLTKKLLGDHGDETEMWEVIQGVWVEMICFSAGRSRGYLHAETLGTGVEYLSYVWALLAYAGMETFPEKLQRREDQSLDIDDYLA